MTAAIHAHAHDDGTLQIYRSGEVILEIPPNAPLLADLASVMWLAAHKAARQFPRTPEAEHGNAPHS